MIEKFATISGGGSSEFLDLNHTSKSMFLVPLMIPKFAPDASRELPANFGIGTLAARSLTEAGTSPPTGPCLTLSSR